MQACSNKVRRERCPRTAPSMEFDKLFQAIPVQHERLVKKGGG